MVRDVSVQGQRAVRAIVRVVFSAAILIRRSGYGPNAVRCQVFPQITMVTQPLRQQLKRHWPCHGYLLLLGQAVVGNRPCRAGDNMLGCCAAGALELPDMPARISCGPDKKIRSDPAVRGRSPVRLLRWCGYDSRDTVRKDILVEAPSQK